MYMLPTDQNKYKMNLQSLLITMLTKQVNCLRLELMSVGRNVGEENHFTVIFTNIFTNWIRKHICKLKTGLM